MPQTNQNDLLVRAFDAAWDFYFKPGGIAYVSEDRARPALIEFLVRKFSEGVDDEPSLAAAGLEFLFSLEDDEPVEPFPSWGLHVEHAGARFMRINRVVMPGTHLDERWKAAQRVSKGGYAM